MCGPESCGVSQPFFKIVSFFPGAHYKQSTFCRYTQLARSFAVSEFGCFFVQVIFWAYVCSPP